jgi:hypothetical protein
LSCLVIVNPFAYEMGTVVRCVVGSVLLFWDSCLQDQNETLTNRKNTIFFKALSFRYQK